MKFDGCDIPALVLIFDEKTSDQIATGDGNWWSYSCIFCLDFFVEDVLYIVLEGQVAMHHGVKHDTTW